MQIFLLSKYEPSAQEGTVVESVYVAKCKYYLLIFMFEENFLSLKKNEWNSAQRTHKN